MHRSLISVFFVKIAEMFADFLNIFLRIRQSVADFVLNVDQHFSGFPPNAAIGTFSNFEGYFAQIKFVSSYFRFSS